MNMTWKLRHKILGALLINFAIISLIFTTVQIPFQERRTQTVVNKVKVLLHRTIKRDEAAYANLIFERNLRSLNLKIDSLLKIDGLLTVGFFDETGKLLASGGNPVLKQNLPQHLVETLRNRARIWIAEGQGQKTIHYVQEIRGFGERIGFIRFYYTLLDIEQEQRLSFVIFGSLLGSIFLIMVLLLSWFLSRSIILPIVHLRRGMRQVQSGELGHQVRIPGNDEISDLAQAFNHMSESLASSYHQIEQQNTELKVAREQLEKYARELEQKNAIIASTAHAYSRFFPHEFLEHLSKPSIVEVELGNSVQREMCILFSDLRSFTSLSETMTPEENFR
ncbi:MAG: HAMP domain-containing protein, partial [SAR324 cluster bacterium]|nr:HAMP domain-containing protein [SAR324 cluster bacterium]